MWERLYPWVWYVWIGWITVFEFLPIITGKAQYTLSEYTWKLEGLSSNWTALRYLIAAFCLWLFFHLAFGLFR